MNGNALARETGAPGGSGAGLPRNAGRRQRGEIAGVPAAAAEWGTPAAAGIVIFQNPQARTHRGRKPLHLVLGEVLQSDDPHVLAAIEASILNGFDRRHEGVRRAQCRDARDPATHGLGAQLVPVATRLPARTAC